MPMPIQPASRRLAREGATSILAAFENFQSRFNEITCRAQNRFCGRNWQGMRRDAAARLDLYRITVDDVEAEIRRQILDRRPDRQVWTAMKAGFSALIADRNDRELAETFYNSVTRRIFSTVGVDPAIEFATSDSHRRQSINPRSDMYRSYAAAPLAAATISSILSDYRLPAPYRDLEGDASRVARELKKRLATRVGSLSSQRIDMLRHPFYRGMGAYLIGRLHVGKTPIPLVLALLHEPGGLFVDGLLTEENDVSILFSFTRAYFHVAAKRPFELVLFLRTLMPRKRTAEVYTTLGYHKHGKTELYRDLLSRLAGCRQEQFEVSAGEKGLVMIAFNLPGDDLVFKLMRDRFRPPKKVSHREVMENYDLVFKHDRAGRLVDAQSFEYLTFDNCFFSAELLAELQREAAGTITVDGRNVVLAHVYVERRVTPLDIFLRSANSTTAGRVVIDFGEAIKDLARSNIFPGDILLKNFGVTRHHRVVFYDYDEICPLLDCRFREFPQPIRDEDDLAPEPWFLVDENDVFPQELRKFLALPEPLLDVFLAHHADLFEIEFWCATQERIRSGDFHHIYPYGPECRLQR